MKSARDIQNVSKCIKKDEKYTFNGLISLVVLGLEHDALVWHSRGQEFNRLQLHQIGNQNPRSSEDDRGFLRVSSGS